MAIETLDIRSWDGAITVAQQQQAITALEDGKVVFLPHLAFNMLNHEQTFLSPQLCNGSRKNVSYDLRTNTLRGIDQQATNIPALQNMMQRYSKASQKLLTDLFPQYNSHVVHARTSYRPVEIAGRVPRSYRKDDTRLHVDAFPSTPTQGGRILRMFSNVNPHGQARVWRIGEDFTQVVYKFAPQVPQQLFGIAAIQKLLKITRSYRTLYDHYMLNIHNIMKSDLHYQSHVTQQEVRFPPGSTWLVYTDQVSHAAMAGQYVFEQTFYLPVCGLQGPQTAPLRVLEKFLQRTSIDSPHHRKTTQN